MSEQFDMAGLLQQAQAVQQHLMEAQAAAAREVVEGQAGGGVVRVKVTGGMEIVSVHLDPKVVDPGDVEMLEDLLLAAMREAVEQAQGLNQQALGGFDLGGLGLGLGGP